VFIKIIFIVKLFQIYVVLNEHKKTYGLICAGVSLSISVLRDTK